MIDEITPEYVENLSIPLPKDRARLDAVIERFERAEGAREQAIAEQAMGLDELEALF